MVPLLEGRSTPLPFSSAVGCGEEDEEVGEVGEVGGLGVVTARVEVRMLETGGKEDGVSRGGMRWGWSVIVSGEIGKLGIAGAFE